jgi:isopentenyldiphosphate isomerase
MLLFRKGLQKLVLRVISRLIPMSNNFSELNRIVWRIFALLGVYIAGNIVLDGLGLADSLYHDFFQKAYVTLLLALVLYEIVRVQIVRAKLLKEEWWPIVNEQGRIIGSVQHSTSLNDNNKYTHPIVRVLIIDRGMILLQKRAQDSLIYPGLWDTAITNHVRMGESIEQCVDRTASQRYKLPNFRYMYLSNYTLEVEKEIHYAFTFVSCQEMAYCIDTDHTEQLKWWTQHQIEENLESGIFNTIAFYHLISLIRNGLFEFAVAVTLSGFNQTTTQQQIIFNLKIIREYTTFQVFFNLMLGPPFKLLSMIGIYAVCHFLTAHKGKCIMYFLFHLERVIGQIHIPKIWQLITLRSRTIDTLLNRLTHSNVIGNGRIP